MSEKIKGFDPFYGSDSEVLILGSFPSVKSRQQNFYYGNPQNRFWKVLSAYFSDELPKCVEDKKKFLSKHKIALWDIVTECEIVGSKDDTIKNFSTANIKSLLPKTKIGFIILNGGKAFSIFNESFGDINIPFVKLPSTSPANTRFSQEEWFNALSGAFGKA